MKLYWKIDLLLLVILVSMSTILLTLLRERSEVSFLTDACSEQNAFRKQELSPELYQLLWKHCSNDTDFSELLTTTMLDGKFHPKQLAANHDKYLKYKSNEYWNLQQYYAAIWADLGCFPIPNDTISFENSFGEPRAYGGQRIHEGCDLFGKVKKPGYYPVLSITNGTVEQVGWLTLGGYRIGIRAEHQGYFYYAHLSAYDHSFQIGDSVKAGDILGFMGNTGYGKEGTTGQFPVHLHLGIYIKTPCKKELSVNPYWVLKAISKKIRNYSY